MGVKLEPVGAYYIVTDLELRAKFDLEELDAELQRAGLWGSVRKIDGIWVAGYSSSVRCCVHPAETLDHYLRIVENLSQRGRELWDRCLCRRFDMGFQGYDERFFAIWKIKASILRRLFEVNGDLVVTVYKTDYGDRRQVPIVATETSELPEHVEKNRAAWRKLSEWFAEPGRESWASSDIVWGIWQIPESEIRALGDLDQWRGKDAIELGCGTGYFSAWLAKIGMQPVGIDITPEQLANAQRFQQEFGIAFPLIEGNAEKVPLPDASFDLALSEYGASIWCDPEVWIPEAARLLRPGGLLVFLRNTPVLQMCVPDSGPAGPALLHSAHEVACLPYAPDQTVEFCPSHGRMFEILKAAGFAVENLVELFPKHDSAETRFDFVDKEWAMKWPTEEIWVARKRA